MNRSLIRDSAIYGAGNLLSRALGFLLIPIYTRYLTVSEFGALSLLVLMLQGINLICLLGISSAAMRFYFAPTADDPKRRQVFGNATLLLLLLPVAALLVLGPALWSAVVSYLPSVPFFPYVMTVLLMGLFTPTISLMSSLLNAQRRPAAYASFHLGYFCCQSIAIVVTVAGLGYGLKGQVYSQLGTSALFGCLALAMLVRYAAPCFSIDITKRLLAFGVPLVAYFICAWIDVGAGRFVIAKVFDLEKVGVFSLANQFAGLLTLVASSLESALLPHFLRRANETQAGEELGILVTRYLVFFSLLALGLTLCATPAILVATTPAYFESIDFVAPLMAANFLYVARNPIMWSLTYSHKPAALSVINVIATVLLIALMLLFIGPWNVGINSVAYAMIIANAVTIVVGAAYAHRSYPLRLQWKVLGTAMGIIGGAALIVAAVTSRALDARILGVQALLFIVVAVVSCRILGIRNPLRLLNLKGLA